VTDAPRGPWDDYAAPQQDAAPAPPPWEEFGAQAAPVESVSEALGHGRMPAPAPPDPQGAIR